MGGMLNDLVSEFIISSSGIFPFSEVNSSLLCMLVEEMYALMKNHSCRVPSPLRLLRIANGKKCEFCREKNVNNIRPGTGAFTCWDCLTKNRSHAFASKWTPNGNNKIHSALNKGWKTGKLARYATKKAKYDAIFAHPRYVCVKKRILCVMTM